MMTPTSGGRDAEFRDLATGAGLFFVDANGISAL